MDSWQDRFWAKVDRKGEDECWPWLGCKRASGHGQFKLPDRLTSSGVAALLASNRERPSEDFWALHHCDNATCCNPEHLYWGTPRQNAHDMHRRGRWKGRVEEDHLSAVLTVAQVKEIFAAYGGTLSSTEIAKVFGVGPSTIRAIWCGRNWTTVTGLTRKRERITPTPHHQPPEG